MRVVHEHGAGRGRPYAPPCMRGGPVHAGMIVGAGFSGHTRRERGARTCGQCRENPALADSRGHIPLAVRARQSADRLRRLRVAGFDRRGEKTALRGLLVASSEIIDAGVWIRIRVSWIFIRPEFVLLVRSENTPELFFGVCVGVG